DSSAEVGAGTCQIQVPVPPPSPKLFPPPRSLLGLMTGPRRLRGHSQSAAVLAHVQWAPGCEAASCHSRVPTLKMPVLGREDS
ncbi:unnamed protein product, partial [Staurois parvus]